jgi:hypothetical protein
MVCIGDGLVIGNPFMLFETLPFLVIEVNVLLMDKGGAII